jgi:carbon monoxide dehydrogenase subunit G
MARYTGIVEAPHSAEDVWHYLSDLRSLREWDPSVDHVELVGGEARTESARYELEVSFRGRALSLPYRTAEVDAPHRVVFTAGTDSVSIRDEALIEPAGPSASTVTWNADVRLRGIRRVIDLLLRAPFKRIGQHAERGLRERLRKPVLTPESGRVRA